MSACIHSTPNDPRFREMDEQVNWLLKFPSGVQTTQHSIPDKNQFAAEMGHFPDCIMQNKTPFTPGEEGLQDQRIMESICQSARENRPVKLPVVVRKDAFQVPVPEL